MTAATMDGGLKATSRVVADFYEGLDFPEGWLEHNAPLAISMGRRMLFSLIAWFDEQARPVAVCWRSREGEEQFAVRAADDPQGEQVLARMTRELDMSSASLGVPDLLKTLLWAPEDVEAWQATPVRWERFLAGRYNSDECGWSVAPRTMMARSGDLLLMGRSVDNGLDLPMPRDASDMQLEPGHEMPGMAMYLPIRGGRPPKPVPVFQWIMLLLFGIAALGTLICYWLGLFT